MRRLICDRLPAPNGKVLLSEAEAHHASRVLRLRAGDRVEALDGRGGAVIARLETGSDGYSLAFDAPMDEPGTEPNPGVIPLRLEIAILKGDAMSWVIEKCVELGVETLVPLVTERTIVRVDRKGPEAFLKRWRTIADQSLKQCGRLHRMEILEPKDFDLYLRDSSNEKVARFWCDEDAGSKDLTLLEGAQAVEPSAESKLALTIGPEGGWGQSERALLQISGARRVTLGPLVMRAETAAIFGVSVLNAWLHSGIRQSSP